MHCTLQCIVESGPQFMHWWVYLEYIAKATVTGVHSSIVTLITESSSCVIQSHYKTAKISILHQIFLTIYNKYIY